MDVAWSFITGLGAGYLIVDAITLAITEDSPVLGTIAHWLGIGGDDE